MYQCLGDLAASKVSLLLRCMFQAIRQPSTSHARTSISAIQGFPIETSSLGNIVHRRCTTSDAVIRFFLSTRAGSYIRFSRMVASRSVRRSMLCSSSSSTNGIRRTLSPIRQELCCSQNSDTVTPPSYLTSALSLRGSGAYGKPSRLW